jgi:maltooligosyltrehalose trehalohydrolase
LTVREPSTGVATEARVRTQNLGASLGSGGACEFVVWAPYAHTVEVHIEAPQRKARALSRDANGYFCGSIESISPGCRYFYNLDAEKKRPDPASRFQPMGVHGPSEVTPHAFEWTDSAWPGLPLENLVLYEIHVGTFTREGTFAAIIPRLRDLKELGITMIEIMPVAQFPGKRNWGYDGVYPYAVQENYGGPQGLKALVNACHAGGLGVALDVVYNHLGPEGNYLRDFGPYFTERYKTPWGEGLNFDGPSSDHVRRFFIENALYWVRDCHIDALRLDAVHAIVDTSAVPFIEELNVRVRETGKELNRRVHVIAESDLNDSRIVRPRELGGYGLDAQWNDDVHHAIHTLLTHEKFGYYEDFGSAEQLAKAYSEGFIYSGQYSTYRQRRYGNSSREIPARRFVVCAQNHDQVGNRAFGERLASIANYEKLKLAAGAVLLSPFIPLLFMGEEYGEEAPFLYFVNHTDPELIDAVRKGRREEFSRFQWRGEVPDPQAEETFERSRLNWSLRREGKHPMLLDLYAELLRLRRVVPALANLSKADIRAWAWSSTSLGIERRCGEDRVVALFNFGEQRAPVCCELEAGVWRKLIDSAESKWGGPSRSCREKFEVNAAVNLEVSPLSFALFRRSVEESQVDPAQ